MIELLTFQLCGFKFGFTLLFSLLFVLSSEFTSSEFPPSEIYEIGASLSSKINCIFDDSINQSEQE